MSQPAGKILVIRGGAIGDFVLTLPALAALRCQFPQARLELLGYARTAPLARMSGWVDEFRSIEARPLAGFFARHGSLAEELQEYLAGFAIIISYLYDPDGIFQGNVARCTKAQFIAGPHRPTEREGVHATEVFLKPLERLAIFDADPIPHLTTVGQASSPSSGSTGDPPVSVGDSPTGTTGIHPSTLALHPGSGGEHKNWPEPQWAELLARLARETDWRFLLIGGEAEGERLARLTNVLPTTRVEIARNLPLVDLARRVVDCHSFVGHDSGITHLAAALGLPGLVLWGPTLETVWRPLGDRMKLVRAPAGLPQLAVETVAAELNLLAAREFRALNSVFRESR